MRRRARRRWPCSGSSSGRSRSAAAARSRWTSSRRTRRSSGRRAAGSRRDRRDARSVGIADADLAPDRDARRDLHERVRRRRGSAGVQLALDLLNGLPSIVIGDLHLRPARLRHQQSGFAGVVGLAIIMLPLVARADAGGARARAEHASGRRASRSVSAAGGPCSASSCRRARRHPHRRDACGRARGRRDRAAAVRTSIYANTVQWDPRHALPNMPVQIFIWSESPDPATTQRAWAAALVLIVFVLVTSLLAQARARPQPEEARG